MILKYFFNFTFFVFVGSSLVATGIDVIQNKKSSGENLRRNFLQSDRGVVARIQSFPPSFPPLVVPRYVLKVEKIYYTRKPRYEFRPVDRVYFKDSLFVQKYVTGRDTLVLPVNIKVQ